MDYRTPKEARLEHIKFYQDMIKDYKQKIETFDIKLEDEKVTGLKRECYVALQEVCKIQLKECQQELRSLL